MANVTPPELTAITDPGDTDLVMVWDTGAGLLKKMAWLGFVTKIAAAISGTYLTVANNLSDLASAAAARANLALGTAATLPSSALFQVSNNLSEVANAATARSNIGAAASDSPTITNGMTFSGNHRGNVQAVGATTLDVAVAEYQTKSISSNTSFTLSGATSGKWSAMLLQLVTTSNAQPTFTGATWSGGAAPTLSNGTHLIGLIYSGSGWAAVLVATVLS